MTEKQHEARLAEIQKDIEANSGPQFGYTHRLTEHIRYLLSLLQQSTGERCGECGDLDGLLFQFQCAAIQRHVLEPDHNTNWNECEFSSCAQARETLARYYERAPTPVQPPVAPLDEGFKDLLPLAPVRIAPGEYEVRARDGLTLWHMYGAALADWVCASVNGYDAAVHAIPSTPITGEGADGEATHDYCRDELEAAVRKIGALVNATGNESFGAALSWIKERMRPPTEATQVAVEAVCANCGKEIHREEDGYWRHNDRNFADCVMFAVPRLADNVDDAEAAQERYEKTRLIEDFNLEWARRREAEQERDRLRAELTTARANAIRECVDRLKTVRISSLWNASGYDTALSNLLEELKDPNVQQVPERCEHGIVEGLECNVCGLVEPRPKLESLAKGEEDGGPTGRS